MSEKDLEKKDVEAPKLAMHTYASDLSNAMDNTDASVVQEILADGREKEQIEQENKIRAKQKGWYSVGSIILIIFTLAATAYTIYHYLNLTVPVQKSASVGVFPSTEIVSTSQTDIREALNKISADSNLEINKPYLIPIIKEPSDLTLLNNAELFSFFESKVSEPLSNSFDLLRLGVMNTGQENVTFVLGSVPDMEVASKELLIAESGLLQIFYKSLNIDISTINEDSGQAFTGEYLYNIPIRVLRINGENEDKDLVFFYGRVTDNIIIFTKSPEILKEVYNSIIRQH